MPEYKKVVDTASGADRAELQKALQRPARELLPRPVYLSMRLEETAAEIAEKARERERLTLELKDPSRDGGPGHRQLRQRRAYVAERLALLRKEQADLYAERKAIGSAAAFEGGDGKRRDGRAGAKNPLIN